MQHRFVRRCIMPFIWLSDLQDVTLFIFHRLGGTEEANAISSLGTMIFSCLCSEASSFSLFPSSQRLLHYLQKRKAPLSFLLCQCHDWLGKIRKQPSLGRLHHQVQEFIIAVRVPATSDKCQPAMSVLSGVLFDTARWINEQIVLTNLVILTQPYVYSISTPKLFPSLSQEEVLKPMTSHLENSFFKFCKKKSDTTDF